METLASVFPAVPALALQRVLEICDGDVETASAWLLENSWRDVLEREDDDDDDAGDVAQEHDDDDNGEQPPPLVRANAAAPAPAEETNPGLTISGDNLHRAGNAPVPATAAAAAGGHHRHGAPSYLARRGGHAATTLRAVGRRDDRDFDSGGEHDGESDDYEEDEDEDDEDDEDDDDDDDDAHSYYDSGDDAFFHGGALAPLSKRVKITKEDADAAKARDPKQEMYWVAFDGQVVRKTLIELLNTTLSKLAHSKVTLLNKSTKHIGEAEAVAKIVSVLDATDESDASEQTHSAAAARPPTGARRSGIDHILNDADAEPTRPLAASAQEDETKAVATKPAAGQKRKRAAGEDEAHVSAQGFFAHFFSVSDLDMIWRSVMHAHLFNARFGEMIEFHTASCGTFNKRDFDELMHIHSSMASSRAASLGLSPVATLKCCLILPCSAAEDEIFRVGKHLHSLLKLQGSLYYRSMEDAAAMSVTASVGGAGLATESTGSSRGDGLPARAARLELLNEDGKMTEDSFRRFARYRIKKEELEAAESKDAHALGPDHFLAYQQQRKVEFCLQELKTDGSSAAAAGAALEPFSSSAAHSRRRAGRQKPMLALDPFVKRSGSSGRPPAAAAASSFQPSASAAAAASSDSNGPTSPAGSAARRGRLHLQPHQPPFEEVAPRKDDATTDDDDDCDAGSSGDEGDLLNSERSRRRFVKPSTTTYEHCFSRNAGKSSGAAGRRYARRPGAQPRVGLASYSFLNSSSTASLALAAAADAASNAPYTPPVPHEAAGAGAVPRTPAVSSLSSALQELMHGRHRALSSYVDATAPQANQRTFVVKQDSDGTFYVASSTGEKFSADSAIGKVFLQPAPERKNSVSGLPPHFAVTAAAASLADDHAHGTPDFADPMRRSDLDFASVQRKSPVAALRRSLSRRDSVEADESHRRSSYASSKAKLLGLSSIKSKLTARRNSFVRRNSLNRGSDRPLTLSDMALHEDEDNAPTMRGGSSGSEDLSFHILGDDNAVPMLDPDLVDARARGDSSWEVPAVPLPASVQSSLAGGGSGESRPTVDKSQIVNRPIPYASGAFNDDDDDDDDGDNLLNRSFLNVRDIEFNPRKDKDAAPVSVSADVLEADTCEERQPPNTRATFDENQPSNAIRDFVSGYRGSSLSAGPDTRMSASNVSEFLGGFKGQLSSRRTSMGQDGGYVNRARSVRNSARKSAAANAANAAATALTRKLRDARSRIPLEFRDDLTPPSKAKKRKNGKRLRVRWDMTLYCREFEVESEDEEEAAAAAANIVKAPWEYRDSEERESDEDDDDD